MARTPGSCEVDKMINVAVIMGRLTADPELKTTQGGNSVCSFTVAVDRNYAPQGQERKTDFINVVAWRQTAEFVSKWFRKGQMIALKGPIQVRNYEDRNGNKRTAVEIVADNISFCGSKAETGAGGQNAGAPAPSGNPAPPVPAYQQGSGAGVSNATPDDFSQVEMDDELPF